MHARAALLCLALAANTASADDGARRSLLDMPAPIAQPQDAGPPPIGPSPTIDTKFGVGGSRRFSAGLRGAQDFEDNTDVSLFAQQTWFVVDDVEIGVEAAGWWVFQDDDTWGVSSSLVTRYHYYHGHKISLYVEGSIGLFIAADNVPDEGTSFGFMPRIGAGTSVLIDDKDTRLLVGVHWHHISNARLNGEARNPSRDGVGIYVAVSVPI